MVLTAGAGAFRGIRASDDSVICRYREESENIHLPTSEERRKIILDMLLKGCYVSDIYERFGVECPDE